MTTKRGRNLLLTPGPSNVPEPVLQAMARNAVDISNPEFVEFARTCIDDLKPVFKTEGEAFVYIANGHGGWEAALVNALSPGDRILLPNTGHFAENWAAMAETLGFPPELIAGDWRRAVDPQAVYQRLSQDSNHQIKAVLQVHTDTATGITNDIEGVRKAIDAAKHPALYMVDAVASLGTTDFRMDEWGVDVTVCGSQKGLMSPPGLGFTAVSEKALEAARRSSTRRCYWDWQRRREDEWYRWFCGTAPEHLLFALRTAMDLLQEEGLEASFDRHRRLAGSARAAVAVWAQAGAVELNALNSTEASNSVTTIRLADGYDADRLKAMCYDRFNVSVGGGLSKLAGIAFRIGHMGDINESMILGGLASVEASLGLCDIPHGRGGVEAAIASLLSQ